MHSNRWQYGKMMLKKSDSEFENFTDEDGKFHSGCKDSFMLGRNTKAGDTYLSLSLNTWKPEGESPT